MLIFPKLEEGSFVKSLQSALISSEFKQELRIRIQKLHAMNRISNLVIYRNSDDASPTTSLTHALTELYPEVEVDASLADLCQIQNLFYDSYHQKSAEIYASHGYSVIEMDMDKKFAFIAQLKIKEFRENPSFIVIHILGNNSREGVLIAMQEYEALLTEAVKYQYDDDFHSFFDLLTSNIAFVVSSAGGKGTSANLLEGFALPSLSQEIEEIVFDKDRALLPCEFVLSKQLQQFGNPSAIRVCIQKKDSQFIANIYSIDENHTETLYLSQLPVRPCEGGLFFGTSESQVNQNELTKSLARFQKRFSLRNNLDIKWPRILKEENSLNTGSNCQNAAKILFEELCHSSAELMSNLLITHTQKQEQGIRASTTALTQCNTADSQHSFKLYVYCNANQEDYIPHLPMKQFIIFAINLLKEFLTEQSYVVKRRYFHYPLPITPELYILSMQTVLGFYNAVYETQLTMEELTFSEALNFFNLTLWPQVEATIPSQGNQQRFFLSNHIVPVIAKRISQDPDKIERILFPS